VTWPTLKVIRPAEIGATELTSSTVQEVAPATYNSGTAYAINNTVSELSGTNNTTANVYRSLQNANTNHTPSTSPLWWTFLGQTYVAYNAGTSYDSTARIADATSHLVYESIQNANLGQSILDTTFWVEVGPTNKYAMFDEVNTTASSAGGSIVVTVAPAGRIDSVALFNLEAATVHIVSSTSGYDETYDLTETSGIDNWYSWFFEPITRRKQLIVSDIPAYLDPTITVTIDNGTDIASVGTMIVGQALDFGMTLADSNSGILSYSKIDANQWGDYTITRRKSVKKISLQVVVDNAIVDKVRDQLGDFDAIPTAWQGTEDFSALAVYGIYRNFTIAFSYPTQSVCSLDLEGLT
jgi:hypothetical protein